MYFLGRGPRQGSKHVNSGVSRCVLFFSLSSETERFTYWGCLTRVRREDADVGRSCEQPGIPSPQDDGR